MAAAAAAALMSQLPSLTSFLLCLCKCLLIFSIKSLFFTSLPAQQSAPKLKQKWVSIILPSLVFQPLVAYGKKIREEA